ncbi:MAG: response regulator [Anaerolineae bacterium]|nr:response regulator [Anaerolineae bacterium]
MAIESSVTLVRELRKALVHLYEQVELRRSPLIELLGLSYHKNPAVALRRLLVEAIEALKPGADVPPKASAWRTYQILSQRYAEQLTQREVATDLGLSIRQLQRHERTALRALADHVWMRCSLGAAACSHHGQGSAPAGVGAAIPTREQELDWLRRSLPNEPTPAAQTVEAALKVAGPFAQSLDVRLESHTPEDLPPLAVQPAPVRQALLVVLTAAINCVPGGRVSVAVSPRDYGACVDVRAVRRHSLPSAPATKQLESLQVARQLAELSGGSLEVTTDNSGPQPLMARLILPAVAQVPVLVVDDNVDALRLFEHYLAGSRYRFIGAQGPDALLAAVEHQVPRIIVLDVMLPRIDGWELLGRLRAHPKTCLVPVVVCSILPQEQLALSLGAAAFLLKPVSRDALLTELDRQSGLSSTVSR